MKTNLLSVLAILLILSACQSNSPEQNGQQEEGESPTAHSSSQDTPPQGTPGPINAETDFILEYKWGIINGSEEPDSVKIEGNGRYFDYGDVEIRTQGTANLSGEIIQYRAKGMNEWLPVSEEDHLFFLGYDGQKHLIIDKGSTKINREIRLFDIQNGSFAYRSKYNNTLVKDNYLYLLRFADPNKLDQVPECDTTRAQVMGYEEVLAISLANYQESRTGQVFCVYK